MVIWFDGIRWNIAGMTKPTCHLTEISKTCSGGNYIAWGMEWNSTHVTRWESAFLHMKGANFRFIVFHYLCTSLFSPPTQPELRRPNFDNRIVIWNSPWPVNLIFGDMRSLRARLLRFCIPIQPGSIVVCLPCQQRRLIGRPRTAELNSSTWLQISHGDITCFASIYDE